MKWTPALLVTVTACTIASSPALESDPENETAQLAATGCRNRCDYKVKIIGCDDRTPKPAGTDGATAAPWRHVGRARGCTATLISGRWVLTAAHCLSGIGTNPIGFTLARSGNSCPYGTVYAHAAYVPADFHGEGNQDDRTRDYALLELPLPIPGAAPMTVGYVPWLTLEATPLRSIGYPATELDGTTPYSTGDSALGPSPNSWLEQGERGLLEVSTDSEGGQSGSPVYVFDNGMRKLVGVLIGDPDEGNHDQVCTSSFTWVSRMTPGAINHLANAIVGIADPFWEVTVLPSQAAQAGCP